MRRFDNEVRAHLDSLTNLGILFANAVICTLQPLLELARRGGLPTRQAEESLDRLCNGMSALPELAKELPIRKNQLAMLLRVLKEDWQRVARA